MPLSKYDRLLARAVRSGWGVPAGEKAKILRRLAALATDPSSSPSDVSKCARAILLGESVGLKAVEVALKVAEQGELNDRIQELENGSRPGAGDFRPAAREYPWRTIP